MSEEPSRRIDSTPSRLRSLADHYPDGILGATRDGDVTLLNSQGAALLGVDPHEAHGMALADVLRLQGADVFTETVPLLDEKGHMTPQDVER